MSARECGRVHLHDGRCLAINLRLESVCMAQLLEGSKGAYACWRKEGGDLLKRGASISAVRRARVRVLFGQSRRGARDFCGSRGGGGGGARGGGDGGGSG